MNAKLRIAIVGTGPAGMYAAHELLDQRDLDIEIDLFERLPTPWGLVRAGVAPDHPEKKMISDRLFRQIIGRPEVRFFGNVEIGRDIRVDELAQWYTAVIFATGAASDLPLKIPGDELPGSLSAREFVAWYNGHPDYRDIAIDLSGERAVIIGNGNVALDVARILTLPIAELEKTDIADHALTALRSSNIREVVILGRRGSPQAAYNTPELEELLALEDTAFRIEGETIPAADAAIGADWETRRKLDVLRSLTRLQPKHPRKTIVFHFLASPQEISGDERVSALTICKNRLQCDERGIETAVATDEMETISTSLVLRAIGYRGREFSGLPFDVRRGVIPNTDGRVVGAGKTLTGIYVTGWIKRGPKGIIGTNKKCAKNTITALLADLAAKTLAPTRFNAADIDTVLQARGLNVVDLDRWLRIERAERQAGRECGRPRVKIADIDAMLAIAGSMTTAS